MPGTTARCGGSQGWHSTRWATAGPHVWAKAPFRVKGITERKLSILHPTTRYPQPQGQAVKGTSQGLLKLLIFALKLRNPAGSGAAPRSPSPTRPHAASSQAPAFRPWRGECGRVALCCHRHLFTARRPARRPTDRTCANTCGRGELIIIIGIITVLHIGKGVSRKP